MGKFRLVIILFFISSFDLFAETNRYMVFLTDKEQSSYSIDNPITFLSQRAIDRRAKSGVEITVEDLPVNESYIEKIRDLGCDVYFQSRWLNALLVQTDHSLVSSIEQLSFVDSVQYIAGGSRLSTTQVPITIPDVFKTPGSVDSDTELQLSLIKADSMHKDGYRGEGMVIAILDSGFPGINEYKMFQHIFDEDRLLGYKDFVTNSGNPFTYTSTSGAHGSSVFSTIAMDYGEEVQGVAPGADFVLCVTEDVTSEYRIEEYNWILGAEYADSIGADVINASVGYSFGFSNSSMNYTIDDLDGKTAIVSIGASIAASKGMVVVVSAGNEGNNQWKYITPPGDADGVVVVGSVNMVSEKSSFSSVGPTADGRLKPDVMALGSLTTIFDVNGNPSQANNVKIGMGSGTSYAAPQIAGLAAAVWQANPEWTSQEVIEAIKYSSNNSLSPDTALGFGIPNYQLAVTSSTLSILDVVEDRVHVYPNPFKEGIININIEGLRKEPFLDLRITDLKGAMFFNQRIYPNEQENVLTIEFPKAESGVYLLSVVSRRYNKSVKLIKF